MGCPMVGDSPQLVDRIKARWTGDWLWNRHAVASQVGCSLYAAGRALRRLERDGWIMKYGDGCAAPGQLWRRR
jgi:hypothetical protein